MPAEPWGTRPKAVKQVTCSVHSQWLNFQDPERSARSDRRAPGRVLGAAVGRVILGEPWSSSPAWPEGGRGICPSLGELGGHSSSAFGLPLSMGLLLGSAHFLGNLQLISGLLWLWLKMEKAQGLWEQKLGLCEAFLGSARVLLDFAILACKSFTYRIIRFHDMKYLYF